MSKERIEQLVGMCKFPGWEIVVVPDPLSPRVFLQVQFMDKCTVTGKETMQHGRKWMLSRHMTDSEIVQTAFKAVLTAMEHEVREKFTFGHEPIFRPHFNVWVLRDMSEQNRLDYRRDADASA